MATRTQLQKDQSPPRAKPVARPPQRGVPAQPGPHKERIKLSEAMRARGLDEWKLAEIFDNLIDRLEKGESDKMLFEALKECGKVLEVYPTPSKFSGGHDPVPVQLVHYVPRPERETQME
jgi:hypothetical protein